MAEKLSTQSLAEFYADVMLADQSTLANWLLPIIEANQQPYKNGELALDNPDYWVLYTMEAMAKMPPINVCLNFESKKGQATAGKQEEGKPQGRDCWSCRTCGNTKPVRMDVDKCRECEDGSQYTEADTPDEKSHEMESEEESEEPDNGNE